MVGNGLGCSKCIFCDELLTMSRSPPIVSPRVFPGFTLVEPLILGILLCIVTAGTALMLMGVNRSTRSATQVDAIASGIDADLTNIRQLSRRYTCCSGTCSTTVPTAFGSGSSCAVNDPDSPSYFFPQIDDPATIQVEPDVVDSICSDANNTAFLTPLRNEIDAMAAPAGVQRTTTIEPGHLLRITYVTTADSRKQRVAVVVPPMAFWCP